MYAIRSYYATDRGSIVLTFDRGHRLDRAVAVEELGLLGYPLLDRLAYELADVAAEAGQCAEDEADNETVGECGQRVLVILPRGEDVAELDGTLLDRRGEWLLDGLDDFRNNFV